MTVTKLQTTDGFVVYDIPDAQSSGLVRRGRKILQRSATDLARSATYGFAFHEIKRGGASAGLNAEGDDASPALAALLAELAEPLNTGRIELSAGKGVEPDELAGVTSAEGADRALAAGVLAAAGWAVGGSFDGASMAIEGYDPANPTVVNLAKAASSLGAVVQAPHPEAEPWKTWSSEVDILLTGSTPGVMNHQAAASVSAKAVVPWGPIPITTKALAVLLRNEVTYVPDFVGASGALVTPHLAGGGSTEQLTSAIVSRLDSASESGEPLFVACCHAAERFLSSWQQQVPFGRPLAG